MSLTAAASGVFPIAPTPFLPDGAVDWTSTEKLFAFYDAIGSDGTTVLGIMGEAPKLEPEESVRIVEAAVAGMPGK
uniref:dihydrodipicolinate synthase family protein n=1 Tax=Bosea sp. (in: a-proteobacteria) TaxID=1871050 RepID=UPI003B3AC738